MANSLYKVGFHGSMVVIFNILGWISVLMNVITKIPCRPTSLKELAISLKFDPVFNVDCLSQRDFPGIRSLIVLFRRRKLYCVSGLYLEIGNDGRVRGTRNYHSPQGKASMLPSVVLFNFTCYLSRTKEWSLERTLETRDWLPTRRHYQIIAPGY